MTWRQRCLLLLLERDGPDCAICGRPVNLDIGGRHPHSASLDHTVAMVHGGDDRPGNWQLTHLVCNMQKGGSPSPRMQRAATLRWPDREVVDDWIRGRYRRGIR